MARRAILVPHHSSISELYTTPRVALFQSRLVDRVGLRGRVSTFPALCSTTQFSHVQYIVGVVVVIKFRSLYYTA